MVGQLVGYKAHQLVLTHSETAPMRVRLLLQGCSKTILGVC